MLRQVEWYAGQGLPDIARRFHWATLEAIDALLAMPEARSAPANRQPARCRRALMVGQGL